MEAALWPYGKCKKCANKNYCAWSESEILNCMNYGYPNYSPMRKADRIRSMTDEEIADFLRDAGQCDRRCPAEVGDCIFSDSACRIAWLAWLKQEVKGCE
jgi:hypothetical protein